MPIRAHIVIISLVKKRNSGNGGLIWGVAFGNFATSSPGVGFGHKVVWGLDQQRGGQRPFGRLALRLTIF